MFRASKEITPDLLVNDIITANYRTAEVFRKYYIDYCHDGKMSLRAACTLKGLHEPDIMNELQQFDNDYQNTAQWSVDFMIDYFINIHHNYFKNNITVVLDYINRFTISHNKRFPEMQPLPGFAQQLCATLASLVKYESERLFPYIKRIIYAYNNNEVYGKLFIKTLRKLSVEELEQYHLHIQTFTSQIEGVTGNFLLPENACLTHTVMFQKLREFIGYIRQHLSIEKTILIPVILQMEKSLLEKIY